MGPVNKLFEYSEDYPTCDTTHATLSIYLPDDYDPNILSEKLAIQPSRFQRNGEIRNGKVRQYPTAWFLESAEHIQSKELRKHIDWILDQIEAKSEVIHELRSTNAQVDISCFWVSAFGHGGPMLDSKILKRIADLQIGISFDIYFSGDEINASFDRVFKNNKSTEK